MLDHISFAVKDFDESVSFYDETLAILGYHREITLDHSALKIAGYGNGGIRPCLWITGSDKPQELIVQAPGVHLAFKGTNVKSIRQWYDKCLSLGATDNGPPGPRVHYHNAYYGAFIIDINGWRLEACLHHYQQ